MADEKTKPGKIDLDRRSGAIWSGKCAAIALSRKVSGVLLVVEAEKTRAPLIEQARRVIETGGGRVLGVILNKRKHHIPGWIYRLL
jgi:hypothetical protein